jgi:hypothetical protein
MREILFIQFHKRLTNAVDAHSPKVGTVYRVVDFHDIHVEEWEDDEGDYQETNWDAMIVSHRQNLEIIVKADDMEYSNFIIVMDEDCPLFEEAV